MDQEVRYGRQMRILVVGAGVAGLSLALHLRQRGFAPDVIHSGAEPSHGSRGSEAALIAPPAAGVLIGLGCFDEFLATAAPMDALRILDHTGREIRTIDLARYFERYGGGFVTTRGGLHALLAERAGPVLAAVGTNRIEQDEAGVDVALSDGTERRYDLVVAADGLRSAVREQMFGPVELTFWDGRAWWFSLEPGLGLTPATTEIWGPGRFAGFYESPGATHCLLAAPAKEDDVDPVGERRDRIQTLFGDLGGPMPDVLERLPEPEAIGGDLLYDLRLDRWARGRVALIGDAAHATIPVVGLGDGMALVSSAVLASQVARADSRHLEIAWSYYIQRRKRRVDIVQDRARERFSMLSVRHRLAAWTRNEILKATSDEWFLSGWDELLRRPI